MPADRPDCVNGLVVGWDTCTLEGSLAAALGGELLAERRFRADRGHTWWLMPQLESMLADIGAAPGDISALAVGTGPGGFTGVKVGVSAAKAVSAALGVPLVGVSTLDIIAAGAHGPRGVVVPLIDARRGMFYASAYGIAAGGAPERLTERFCAEPGRIASVVLGVAGGPVLLAGRVDGAVASAFEAAGASPETLDMAPAARDLLRIAGEALRAGDGRVGSGLSVLPTYLREPL